MGFPALFCSSQTHEQLLRESGVILDAIVAVLAGGHPLFIGGDPGGIPAIPCALMAMGRCEGKADEAAWKA